ncbi:MAG: putative LPS assembly protein LptD [Candidatus Neomarinimicrobiota bacterium]
MKFLTISIFLFAAYAAVLYAKDEPIELLNAATMQKVTLEGENKDSYIFFDKDVHLRQGEINIFADRAYQYPERDLLRLQGNVHIFDDSVSIYFENGSYQTNTRDIEVSTPLNIYYDTRYFTASSLRGNLDSDIYRAQGNVEIRDSISCAAADSLLFDRVNERAFLYGNAVMSDTVSRITMRGSELEYRLDTDQFFGHRDASVYESREDGAKRFEVFAKHLKGDMKKGWLIAKDSVYVYQDSAAAWCDSLFYLDSTGTVEFYGNARVRYKNIDMYAGGMQLRFEHNHLDDLSAADHPRVSMLDEGYLGESGAERVSKLSEMKGKNLYLKFNREDAPDWMRMNGMVVTDYHVFKDSVYKGINNMSSDTIRIYFESGEVCELFASYDVRGKFTPDSSYDEMDTTAVYLGNEVHYDLRIDRMAIYPGAQMNYGEIQLRADTLKIDWESNILFAIPEKNGERPEFIQGNDPAVYGDLFEYNLDTQRGRITRGKTHIKEGYYHGKSVLKTEDKPLFVSKGVFSTCELDEPHFCVEAKRMKVIPGDRVFAQDIVFKVLDIPLLYIPSFFVSIEEGDRRSGWILPTFGRYSNKGWALEGFGYYWAPNDYYDARLLMKFYDNYGISAELRQRYAWRDHISNGSLLLEYWNYFWSSDPVQGYRIRINHPQSIGLRSRLNISGTFTNDTQQFTRELDKDERLEQQMVSNASFSTSLGPFSVNLNVSRTEDLLTGSRTTNFPQFSLSRSNAKIFKRKKLSDPEKWYHKFTYSVNSKMINQTTHIWNNADSLFYDETKNKMESNVGVRYNDKLFGFLTLSPYLNYYEDWTTRYKTPVMQNDSVLVDSNGTIISFNDVNRFKRRGRFDLGSSASTTLYGVFNLNLGPLKALRHTLAMSLNYVYRPDQSNNPEYVFRGIGTDGNPVTYDYFKSTLLSPTPSAGSQSFTMNFNHKFESKTQWRGMDEKKLHFLTLTHAYNFLADSLRSSNINAASTVRDLPGGLAIKLDASFDPYTYRINEDGKSITRINQFAVPRVSYLRISTDLNLKPGTSRRQQAAEKAAAADSVKVTNTNMPAKGADEGFSRWSATAGISFTRSAANPLDVKNRLLVNTEIKAYLTPKWSGSYRINFDVLEHSITDQRITLTRDLHCWALHLDWNPGYSFFIRLNVKSDMLKALKLEKQTGRYY